MKKLSLVLLLAMPLFGCSTSQDSVQLDSDLAAVDSRSMLVMDAAKNNNFDHALTIDHSRLAKEAEAELAASRVDLYTDNELNSELIEQNTLVGLDLPFRVISYAEQGQIKTMYTNADFLQKRYDLAKTPELARYQKEIAMLVQDIPNAKPVNSTELKNEYGIKKLESEYDFDTTLANIKRDVLEEGDTIWFMNWDYKAKAQAVGKTLPDATLLVFGAPAPGATAMADYPSIGLDAFGQKVLVYKEGDKVIVAYNDIVDLSELHYGDSALVHKVINFRLGKTLSNAVEK